MNQCAKLDCRAQVKRSTGCRLAIPWSPSPGIESDTTRLFGALLSLYQRHPLGEVRSNTTEDCDERVFHEDLVAALDLMCEATYEVITALKREYADIPAGAAKLPQLSDRAQSFLNWYAGDSLKLKHYICTFERREEESSNAWILPPDLLTA